MKNSQFCVVASIAIACCTAVDRAIAQSPLIAPIRHVAEDLRIDGAVEGFNNLDRNTVGVMGNGQVVLWDDYARQLKFYKQTGGLLATAGRKGNGPGEFGTSAVAVGLIADSAWVYDPSQRRVTYFGPTGKMLRTANVPSLSWAKGVAPGGAVHFHFFELLSIYADGSLLGIVSYSSGESSQSTPVRRFCRVSASGEIQRLMASPPANTGVVMTTPVLVPAANGQPASLKGSGRMGGVFSIDPIGSTKTTSPDGSRFATRTTRMTSATKGIIQLDVMRAAGDTLFSRAYQFDGTPLPARVVNEELAKIRNSELRDKSAKISPAIYAPVEAVVLGFDDTTWLQLHATAKGTPMLMLNSRGDPVSMVIVPGIHVSLAHATATTLWILELDDDDVPSVVRYHVASAR